MCQVNRIGRFSIPHSSETPGPIFMKLEIYNYFPDTQRGRSRGQHVRDCEADVEGAKNLDLVHLRRSKGEAHRAEPTFGFCFLQRRR